MANWKTTKYTYDNIKFMSQGEVEMYKILKASQLSFNYQPEPIEIIPKFKGTSGKTYQTQKYEPDFVVNFVNPNLFGQDIKIYIEVKGKNDSIYIFRKGQKPQIKDNSELYRLRHKLFDQKISDDGNIFLVVRPSDLKTSEYAGMFWEQDLQVMRRHKKQGNKELCAKVPRIIERIGLIIKEMAEKVLEYHNE